MESQAVILFSVKGVNFVLPALDVVSIIEKKEFQFVLGAPDYVPGLTVYMGETLLTIDIAKKLGLEGASEESESPQLLIIQKELKGQLEKFSLMVDQVSDVKFIDANSLLDVLGVKEDVLKDLFESKIVTEVLEIEASQYGFFNIENVL